MIKKSEKLAIISYILYWVGFSVVCVSALNGNRISQVIAYLIGVVLIICFIFLICRGLICFLEVDNEVAKKYGDDIGW